MTDNGISKLNTKELTARIASDALAVVYRQTREEVSEKIIELAVKWGAKVVAENKAQFKNELCELFIAPAQWPSVEVQIAPVLAGVTNSATVAMSTKAPGRVKKSDSTPKTKDGLKASDFRSLVVPAGTPVPTCPTTLKSGDRKDQACGKECKKVTNDHDLSNPECASLQCEGHMFCGQHVVKAAEAGGSASTRLKSSANPEAKPVTLTNEDGETRISASAVGNNNNETTTAAGKEAVTRLVDRMKARKQAQKEAQGSVDE